MWPTPAPGRSRPDRERAARRLPVARGDGRRRPGPLRRGGRGSARAARPRLPRVVVLVAPPAAGARRRRLPRRGDRRARLRPFVQAGARSTTYRMVRHVADNVGLVGALGEEQAVVVGHDWGAPIAWNSALLRPDVFRAVAGLSVPFAPGRSDVRPTDAFRAMGGDEEFYIEYFQQPGRAEAEIEADVRGWLLGFYFTASGDAPPPAERRHGGHDPARRRRCSDRFRYPDAAAGVADRGRPRRSTPASSSAPGSPAVAQPLPQRRSRLGGPRRVPRRADRGAGAVHRRRPRRTDDLGSSRHRRASPRRCPSCTARSSSPGCGHWTQQERPDEVNEALLDFLQSV